MSDSVKSLVRMTLLQHGSLDEPLSPATGVNATLFNTMKSVSHPSHTCGVPGFPTTKLWEVPRMA